MKLATVLPQYCNLYFGSQKSCKCCIAIVLHFEVSLMCHCLFPLPFPLITSTLRFRNTYFKNMLIAVPLKRFTLYFSGVVHKQESTIGHPLDGVIESGHSYKPLNQGTIPSKNTLSDEAIPPNVRAPQLKIRQHT